MADPILSAEHIAKSFDGTFVFEDLTLALEHHETLALTGPSGIGKTTLLNILSGLTMPDHGQVTLDGEDITGQAGRISYMQQKDLLLPYYTVLRNVALPLEIRGVDRQEAAEQASEKFAFFGLEGCENMYPHELSGGMRQRAALLRTYMQSQKVVLLDEPFGALDASTRRKMQEWYLGISAETGLSTLFITHDPDEAILMSDRVMVLNSSPARITAEFSVDRGGETFTDFQLSERFLEYKRRLLEELQGETGVR